MLHVLALADVYSFVMAYLRLLCNVQEGFKLGMVLERVVAHPDCHVGAS